MKNSKIKKLLLSSSALFLLALLAGCGAQQAVQQKNAPSAGTKQNQIQAQIPVPPSNESPSDVMIADNPSLGKIFTDGKGLTLYEYTKDTKDKSTCYGACAVNWPALTTVKAPKIGSNLLTEKFGVITRTDGAKQITFEGAPLYYFIKDKKPGDTNGQGIGGNWFVYKVADDDLSPSKATPEKK